MNNKIISLEPKYLCMIKNILRDQLGDLGLVFKETQKKLLI